jgi:hypothetical protein
MTPNPSFQQIYFAVAAPSKRLFPARFRRTNASVDFQCCVQANIPFEPVEATDRVKANGNGQAEKLFVEGNGGTHRQRVADRSGREASKGAPKGGCAFQRNARLTQDRNSKGRRAWRTKCRRLDGHLCQGLDFVSGQSANGEPVRPVPHQSMRPYRRVGCASIYLRKQAASSTSERKAMSGKASAVSAGRNQMSTKVLGKPNKNSRQKTSSDGYLVHSHRDEKWAVLDSNQRPPRCQRGALTN